MLSNKARADRRILGQRAGCCFHHTTTIPSSKLNYTLTCTPSFRRATCVTATDLLHLSGCSSSNLPAEHPPSNTVSPERSHIAAPACHQDFQAPSSRLSLFFPGIFCLRPDLIKHCCLQLRLQRSNLRHNLNTETSLVASTRKQRSHMARPRIGRSSYQVLRRSSGGSRVVGGYITLHGFD